LVERPRLEGQQITDRKIIMNDVKSARAAKREASSASLWKWGAGAAAAGRRARRHRLLNRSRAKRAERDNPPLGSFVTVTA
jgi:hypothetical protein